MIPIALWTAIIKPGQKLKVSPPADLRLTNVALGDKLEDANGRTTVKLSFRKLIPDNDEEDDEEDVQETGVVCSLTPGKIEQQAVELLLPSGNMDTYLFESSGKNSIHLYGNYVDTGSDDAPSDFSDSDEEEAAYRLDEVSSDVEMELDPLEVDSDASRFEELDDEDKKQSKPASESLKRARESEGGAENLSKAEKKKAKKLKAGDGTAVPVASPESSKKPASTAADKAESAKKPESKKDEKKAAKPAAAEKELAGGVKIKDTTVGEGPVAKKGHKVSMRYIGKLQSGKVFDKNVKGKPFTFNLGKGEVIKGWDEGIVGMQPGGERVLTIPGPMAYGKRGSPPEIPPNATLIFEVKLVDVKQ